MRGFIDDTRTISSRSVSRTSQSAFMRGFIDDATAMADYVEAARLNPRSCAASSMTGELNTLTATLTTVSIRVHARLHR